MINIELKRDIEKPLFAQIRDELSSAIKEKKLNPGDKLPTVNELAKRVGVTQATIRRAYEDLIKAGLLGSHVGRGTFVIDPKTQKLKKPLPAPHAVPQSLSETNDSEFMLAARRLRMGISHNLNNLMALLQRPGLIRFTTGIPDPAIIKKGLLSEITKDALKGGEEQYFDYGHNQGNPELRAEIAARYEKVGTPVHADQILLTNGSQQAVSVLAQAAIEKDQRVICETPCYMGIPNAFGALGHWVEPVPRDFEGPLPEKLDHFRDGKSTILYLCTELHNPMGTNISPDRRLFVIDWAREQNATVIVDEIFHDLQFNPTLPASFLSDLGANQTVVIGSLSKSFMCGLRVGWMISSQERIRSILALKRAMDISCPQLMQGIALSLLKSGEYDNHVKKARLHYKERCNATIQALEQHMPDDVTWTIPQGGMHMWIELPTGYSSIVLFFLAIERGVGISPGPLMDVDHRFINGFRLSYGSLTVEEIKEGIELLSDAVKELIKEPPKEVGLSGLGDFL